MDRIAGYRFGPVTVDGREITRDVIVLPVASSRTGGADQRMRPDPNVLDLLKERGIEVECLPTDLAVARFAELDPGKTAAALHLTC